MGQDMKFWIDNTAPDYQDGGTLTRVVLYGDKQERWHWNIDYNYQNIDGKPRITHGSIPQCISKKTKFRRLISASDVKKAFLERKFIESVGKETPTSSVLGRNCRSFLLYSFLKNS